MVKITVIIASLMRPSLQQTLDSLRLQNIEYILFIRNDPSVSEYESRQMAVKDVTTPYIAFLDDDAYYDSSDVLARACHYLDTYTIIDGAIVGNMFGSGRQDRLDLPMLGAGTALFMRTDAFNAVGGFKVEWGKEPGDGWRLDTVLLWDIVRKYGIASYKHCSDIVVRHPNPMQSHFNEKIERKMYENYREECEKYIMPIDPRIRMFAEKWKNEAKS